MNGAKNLDYLLREANPALDPEEYVFVSRAASYGDHMDWEPVATISEQEGMTFVIRRRIAEKHGLRYDSVFSRVTLQVHSSLEAVGLTARFAARLAEHNISANVFAGFYHDHIFVAKSDGPRALQALTGLAD